MFYTPKKRAMLYFMAFAVPEYRCYKYKLKIYVKKTGFTQKTEWAYHIASFSVFRNSSIAFVIISSGTGPEDSFNAGSEIVSKYMS